MDKDCARELSGRRIRLVIPFLLASPFDDVAHASLRENVNIGFSLLAVRVDGL